MQQERLKGRVLRWGCQGFGFIGLADGRHVYVDQSQLCGSSLVMGETVTAIIVQDHQNPEKLVAHDVQRTLDEGSAECDWPQGKYYDFIEVGTADWGTLTHYCAYDEARASDAGRYIWSNLDDLRWARGLAIDPIAEHLDALPDLPQVEKIEAAMDEWSGEHRFYFVSPENIEKYKGKYSAHFSADWWSWPVDVFRFAGSLGSLGKTHPNLDFMLESIGRTDLLDSKPVAVLDWGRLCEKYQVRAVDVVQLDCEGKDCAVIRGMLRYCTSNPRALPRVIHFEANHLTSQEEIESTLLSLAKYGYQVVYRTQNNILVER